MAAPFPSFPRSRRARAARPDTARNRDAARRRLQPGPHTPSPPMQRCGTRCCRTRRPPARAPDCDPQRTHGLQCGRTNPHQTSSTQAKRHTTSDPFSGRLETAFKMVFPETVPAIEAVEVTKTLLQAQVSMVQAYNGRRISRWAMPNRSSRTPSSTWSRATRNRRNIRGSRAKQKVPDLVEEVLSGPRRQDQ